MPRENGTWYRRAATLYRKALTDPCPATRTAALLAASEYMTREMLHELDVDTPPRSAEIIPFVRRRA